MPPQDITSYVQQGFTQCEHVWYGDGAGRYMASTHILQWAIAFVWLSRWYQIAFVVFRFLRMWNLFAHRTYGGGTAFLFAAAGGARSNKVTQNSVARHTLLQPWSRHLLSFWSWWINRTRYRCGADSRLLDIDRVNSEQFGRTFCLKGHWRRAWTWP